jgi:5-methylcytosine-specific restriction endonuclease McrA
VSIADKEQKLLDELVRLAAAAGVRVEMPRVNNGHYKLHGKLLVNYYPFSKNRTAYVAGTTQGHTNISPKRAIEMTQVQPKRADVKDERSGNTRKIRKRLMRGRPCVKCHWCPAIITLDTSTLEHIIPLDLGGLDNDNNRTLACHECNHNRGNNMPELKEQNDNATE